MRQLAHNRHYYEAFPFLLFFRAMENEEILEQHNVSQGDWEEIKKRWILKNENWSTDAYAKAQRDELAHRSKYNKLLFLKERATWSEEGLKDLFEKVRLKWDDDRLKRDGNLLKELNKAKKLQEIYAGQKKGLEEQKLNEFDDREGMSVENAYQCIASLELAGATIPDYEKLTLGKYDALSATLEKRSKKAS
ncbi:hypothetical protein FGF1_03380 [Flavobacteriaceae bacterium GF1]